MVEMIQLSVAFFAACVICSVLEACEKAFMANFAGCGCLYER